MKKVILLFVAVFLVTCSIISCGQKEDDNESKADSSAFEESSKEATSLAEISIDPIIDKENLNLVFTESSEAGESDVLMLAFGITDGRVLSAEQLGVTPEEYNKLLSDPVSDGTYDIETDLISIGDELHLYSHQSEKAVTCERVFLRFVMFDQPYLFIKIDSEIHKDYHAVCSTKPMEVTTCEKGAKTTDADVDNDDAKEKVELDIRRDGSLVHCEVLFDGSSGVVKEYYLTANGDISIFAVCDINGDGSEEAFIRADGVFEGMSEFEVCGLKSEQS